MEDKEKTKEQLIKELAELRSRITVLEESEGERIRSEQALMRERDIAQKYLDVAGVMFVVINKDQRVTLINKKGCEVLGYSEEEIVGKNWFKNFLPKNITKQVETVFNKLMNGEIKPVEYFENPILTKKGDERIISWHNTIISDDSGEIVATLGSGEDITERKQTEENLLQEKQRLEDVTSNANCGLLLLDDQTRVTFANRVAEKWFGPLVQSEDSVKGV